jgi:hypothetical protein
MAGQTDRHTDRHTEIPQFIVRCTCILFILIQCFIILNNTLVYEFMKMWVNRHISCAMFKGHRQSRPMKLQYNCALQSNPTLNSSPVPMCVDLSIFKVHTNGMHLLYIIKCYYMYLLQLCYLHALYF